MSDLKIRKVIDSMSYSYFRIEIVSKITNPMSHESMIPDRVCIVTDDFEETIGYSELVEFLNKWKVDDE